MSQTNWRSGSWIALFGIAGVLWFLIMPGLVLGLALALGIGGWLLSRTLASPLRRQFAREAIITSMALLAFTLIIGIIHVAAGSSESMAAYLTSPPVARLQPAAGPCACESRFMDLAIKLVYSLTVPTFFVALVNEWRSSRSRDTGFIFFLAAMAAYTTAILIHEWRGETTAWVWPISLGICVITLVVGVVWFLRSRRRGESKEIATAFLMAVAVPFILALSSLINLLCK